LEHSKGVNQYTPSNGDVYFWSRRVWEVGAQRSEPVNTRQWRCAVFGAARKRRLEHSGGVCMNAPNSGDVYLSEQEGAGGQSTVEE
jgi:hypothetical protein